MHNHSHLVRDLLNPEFCTLHFKLSIYRNTMFPLSTTFCGFIYYRRNKTTNGTHLPQLLGHVWIRTPLINFFHKSIYFWSKLVICGVPYTIKNQENTETWRIQRKMIILVLKHYQNHNEIVLKPESFPIHWIYSLECGPSFHHQDSMEVTILI